MYAETQHEAYSSLSMSVDLPSIDHGAMKYNGGSNKAGMMRSVSKTDVSQRIFKLCLLQIVFRPPTSTHHPAKFGQEDRHVSKAVVFLLSTMYVESYNSGSACVRRSCGSDRKNDVRTKRTKRT